MEHQTSCALTPATLYFDGRCDLCTREMAKLETIKGEQLSLVDIHSLPDDSDLPDKDQLLRTLHLRNADGEFISGIEANVAAWQYTDRGKWFTWMLWPPVRVVSMRVYAYWAQWRYRRLYGDNAPSTGGGDHAAD